MTTKPDRAMRRLPKSQLGMDWEQKTRAKIQAGGIVSRLILFVKGELALEPAQVTAAVHLMKKVLPDVSFVEHAGEVSHRVIRAPAVIETTADWTDQHTPPEFRNDTSH